ncbi:MULTISPECIES: carbohydrate ABC transporter permease [unclassified Rathayibacter]|uniref:carbohydrate ABC transporter permease n=1 Tax=unclassified Rathayibacter TaxID=2609250 RepID=UPI000F4B99F8|nr:MULTISPECIES: sugar ABC transporter permease [unclassified Rathayibacter]ROQ65015.1 carbohydrate ABC transporter membrane protein 1 (CUT1 family) [Rathayibacter sp. PhB152]ROS23304.1 carbohydrate ABC transporter membrane protein 1 (CUT1 family) [Rathayibacter sp. PhB127]
MTTSTPARPRQSAPEQPRRKHPRRRALARFGGTGFVAALPFLAPALAAYLVFVVGPSLESVRLSFFEWSGFQGAPQVFVGLQNYVRIFTQDPVFWTAFSNTLIWVVLSLFIPVGLGLVMALALNRPLFGRNAFRSLFYIPGVLAPIAIANMWRWMYNPNYGVGVNLAQLFDLPWLAEVQWLGDKNLALYSIFAAFVWQIAGTNMVLFLAGLQSVSPDHVEAARLDGANAWQVFRNVTIPALRPTTVIVVVLTIINSIKVFDLIVGMTGGGPAQQTQVLALWSFQQSFNNHEYGQGNAIATVLLVITLVIVVPYMVWTARQEKNS